MTFLDKSLHEIFCYDKDFAHRQALLHNKFQKLWPRLGNSWDLMLNQCLIKVCAVLRSLCDNPYEHAAKTKPSVQSSHFRSHKLTSILVLSCCFVSTILSGIAPCLVVHNFYWWMNNAGILDASPCCGSITTLSTEMMCMKYRNASLNTQSTICSSMLMAARILLFWLEACHMCHNIAKHVIVFILTIGVKSFLQSSWPCFCLLLCPVCFTTRMLCPLVLLGSCGPLELPCSKKHCRLILSHKLAEMLSLHFCVQSLVFELRKWSLSAQTLDHLSIIVWLGLLYIGLLYTLPPELHQAFPWHHILHLGWEYVE